MLNQYKVAIEKSNIISKTDINGIITFVNDEFCKISGYSKDELIGQNHNIVRHPDIEKSKFKLLWDTINSKNIYKATVKNLAKNATAFYVNTTITPILDENGNIIEFIAIRYDVTKEVVYKEELEKKEKELKDLNTSLEKRVEEKTAELLELNETLESRIKEEISKNEAKQKVMFWQARLASLGEMLANIAHQWRQPLTELNLIVFSIKKAAMNGDDKEVQKFYDDSKNIIKNMSNTIDDFTNFFMPDKEKQYFNVTTSIDESLNILEQIIKNEMVAIKTEFEDVKVLGIMNELNQVIINLIKNSIDSFINKSILIREINIRVRKDLDIAIIEFQDNAGGIKEKNIYKIFEPYFTTKYKSQGTGLGLFMSKMICEKGLNGSLDVKSRKNMTTFTIKIPIEEENA
ncbi:MAG: PAS domain-containing sensor histidine kinase [Sulfurimonas sp.]|nr:PAS domain-containing sensor histidine kinase [Sulfurimonas sp.]